MIYSLICGFFTWQAKIRRLELCVKWLQKEDEKHILEEERLKVALNAAEKKVTDYEDEMKEILQASLKEELERAHRDIAAANQKASQDEAIYIKESLVDEVKCLRVELQQARDDRDHHAALVKVLEDENDKYIEMIGKPLAALDHAHRELKLLEEISLSQGDQLCELSLQLDAVAKELKIYALSASETKIGSGEQRRTIRDLQEQLAKAENRLLEGEKLREKLHNTILELHGNIRKLKNDMSFN